MTNNSKNKHKESAQFWRQRISLVEERFLLSQVHDKIETENDESFYQHELNRDVQQLIEKMSGGDQLAKYVILLSALMHTLRCYTDRRIVNIDIPLLNNKPKENTDSETIPFIMDVSNETIIKEHIVNIQKFIIESYSKQNVPLKEWFEVISDLDKDNLSNVILYNHDIHDIREDVLLGYALRIGLITNDDYTLRFDFDHNIFTKSFIINFAQHLEKVIKGFSSLEKSLADITMFSSSELNKLNVFSSGTKDIESKFSTVVEAFEFNAQQSPDQTALVYENKKFTYGQVNEKSNQLAHLLINQFQIEVGDVICVILERSELNIIALLAILKAGGVYLPVDPETPVNRIKHILNEAGVKHIVTHSNCLDLFETFSSYQITVLDKVIDKLTTKSTNVSLKLNKNSLAYIIYTSGSTGEPKGVLIKHGGLLNVSLDHVNEFKINSNDVIMLVLSLSFDGAYLDIFMALVGGATLVVSTKDTIHSTKNFIKSLEKNKVSIVTLTPSYLNTLNHHPLNTVRLIVSAGEAANIDDLKFYAQFKKVYNGYGPSEATINSALFSIDPSVDYYSIPIGKPRSNKKIYVLDQELSMMPIGQIGEICISGSDLAVKYINDEQLTEKCFVQNPFDNGRLYRTGDFGRWLPSGDLEFIGRKDNQVKINGHRIDLNEIKRVLASYPAIGDTSVVLNTTPQLNQLVAFYKSEDQERIDGELIEPDTLKKYLQSYLPKYMLPAKIIRLEEFPVTANGKIDTRALLEHYLQMEHKGKREEDYTTVERELIKIWQQLLEVDSIGIQSDFFELGGQSIKSIQILSRVYDIFKIELDADTLYHNPTIETLAKKIESEMNVVK
jgi:amino acid adenylation domain-containing protein